MSANLVTTVAEGMAFDRFGCVRRLSLRKLH